MQKGIAKWFDSREGHGSIVYNEEDEIFVHFAAIEGDGFRSLDGNQSAEFRIMEGNHGLRAAHVKKIDN